MIFAPEFYQRISTEPQAVAFEICTIVKDRVSTADTDSQAALLLEAGKILDAMSNSKLIECNVALPSILNGKPRRSQEFYNYISNVHTQLEANSKRDNALKAEAEIDQIIARSISNQFGYELTDGDLQHLQSSIDEFESIINESPDFSDDHKKRLLKRINELKIELHKKLTNLDKVYCLAIEAQMLAYKYSSIAAPVAKIAKMMMDIAIHTHKQTEGLASDSQPISLNNEAQLQLIESSFSNN